jgi:chromate transport protein ChrA
MSFPINNQDVIAIAKARVSRENSKVTNYWYYGLIVAIFAGVLLFRVASIAGWVVIIVAVVGFVWYSVKLNRKQNIAAHQLLKEWNESKNTEVK